MARPRVFISSTFYDLKQIRADLERFIKQMGYDPVRNERGKIAYGSDKKLEDYCYREIDLCDMVVSIVGGRFGSDSQQAPYSISQMELKTAIEHGKAVYIFIERSVRSEFSTYLKNKTTKGIKFNFVDSIEVYKFLEEIEALPKNNPISSFENVQEIIDYLKEQWAGLFQRYLQEQNRLKEVALVESMSSTAQTLNQLVTFLTEERRSSDQAIRDILLSSHPAFKRLAALLKVRYRIFFTNRGELTVWLRARAYEPVPENAWDDPQFEEWVNIRKEEHTQYLLKVSRNVFDKNGKLKIYTPQEWDDNWIHLESHPLAIEDAPAVSDEDIPF
jgi:hypothetical protein